jgi:ISXO2-like transposase domain
MDFPIDDLMNQDACSQSLRDRFHPAGLRCPRRQAAAGFFTHRYFREPVLDYRGPRCGRVFNAWTDTPFQGTQWRPSQIVLILRGFAQGTSTAPLARELSCSRRHLLDLRHRLQARARAGLDRTPWVDRVVEADEMDQNAGANGAPHPDPEDPPRRRANEVRGPGTRDNDRPPVVGVVGREAGPVRLEVVERADQEAWETLVVDPTPPGAVVNTDEWAGSNHLPEKGRGRAAACHTPGEREWARDDDGDGVREVHNNTVEGLWAGLRNFLRPFRGVNKWFLGKYVAMFEWAYNIKEATSDFLRALLGIEVLTNFGP